MNILIKDTNTEDLHRALLMFSGHEIVETFEHGDLIDSDEVEECPMKNEVNKPKLIKNAWWLISGLITSPDDYSTDYKLGYIEGVVHTIGLLLADDLKVNPDYIVDGLDEEEE